MRLGTALCSAVSTLFAPALLSACGSGSTTSASSDTPPVGVDHPRSVTDFWNSYIKVYMATAISSPFSPPP